jgi:adenylylsulfate kinase-like enzyme
MCGAAVPSTVIRVIIWLNGTFGVGKTSTADRLKAMVPDSRVFDPEIVGDMLRRVLSDRPDTDYQDWAAWRPLVAASLTEIARMTGQHVIAPMTVLKRDYLDQIFTLLRAGELDVFHVLLDADDEVLRRRIEGTGEAQAWRLGHLDQYAAARTWLTEAADLVVDTAASTPPQIARKIFSGLPEQPDLTGPDLTGPDLPGPDLPGPDLPGPVPAKSAPAAKTAAAGKTPPAGRTTPVGKAAAPAGTAAAPASTAAAPAGKAAAPASTAAQAAKTPADSR